MAFKISIIVLDELDTEIVRISLLKRWKAILFQWLLKSSGERYSNETDRGYVLHPELCVTEFFVLFDVVENERSLELLDYHRGFDDFEFYYLPSEQHPVCLVVEIDPDWIIKRWVFESWSEEESDCLCPVID